MRIPGRKTLLYGARLLRSKLVTHGIILGYHRINTLPWDPFRQCVSAEHFTQHLDVLHEQANVIPLHALAEANAAGELAPRCVAITFDDGYADFLSGTRPLLQRAAMPSTLFITSGTPGKEFWWDTLVRLVEVRDPAQPLKLDTGDAGFAWQPDTATNSPSRDALIHALHRFLMSLDNAVRTDCLQQLAAVSRPLEADRDRDRALTESEISTLANDELVTIGCHTVSHPMLDRLNPDQQRAEILQNKETLEQLTGKAVAGFSYPHGVKSATTVGLVRDCGFTHACASHNDVVWRNSNPYCLPRIWVPDIPGEAFRKLLLRWL
ncbi:MAG TPA: polysaccharide deacetylase family protein [Gammaproteobacteria bacterium]|nr:polysaccharide deacetylase family protein [Gammaproteobacteria bacterium]